MNSAVRINAAAPGRLSPWELASASSATDALIILAAFLAALIRSALFMFAALLFMLFILAALVLAALVVLAAVIRAVSFIIVAACCCSVLDSCRSAAKSLIGDGRRTRGELWLLCGLFGVVGGGVDCRCRAWRS